MAFTYLIVNLLFIVTVVALLGRWLYKPTKGWWVTLAGLLLLTLIFDNVIILLGFVEYDHRLLLGIYAWSAPIEDFFYSILAVILVPALWNLFKKKPIKETE